MTITWLTKSEAMREFGLTKTTIQMAITRGLLPAEKMKLPIDRGGTPCMMSTYRIRRSDLDEYLLKHRPKTAIPWADADTEALLELADTCTDAQIAEYLGRNIGAVGQKLHKLRRSGIEKYRKRRGSVNAVAFVMPREAVLIAKTCHGCGKLRDAVFFQRRYGSNPIHAGKCRVCLRSVVGDRANKYRDLKQKVTADQATRRGFTYTQKELDVIADESKSALEVALELHRSYIAVNTQRAKLGLRTARRVGDSHWTLDFPNAVKALQEHYRGLGVVPEVEWEWNDEECTA